MKQAIAVAQSILKMPATAGFTSDQFYDLCRANPERSGVAKLPGAEPIRLGRGVLSRFSASMEPVRSDQSVASATRDGSDAEL
ncbi:hypothetical protein C8255_05270 [filamentous cyanobacterium CCP3]|nr:hypothetical protein C8255_05270 [filamentous cyanobacterium CCP3]